MKGAALFLAVCLLLPAAAPLLHGQKVDLVALKKREEERRKMQGQSKAKVTNDNLERIAGSGRPYGFVQMDSGEPPSEEEASLRQQAEKKQDVTKQPDFWQKQKADLEQRIAKLRADVEREQSELNRLWSDFYIKNIAAEQEAIRAQISQLTTQIEQKKLFLAQAETQLEDLCERARKSGAPPGWLR